MRFDIMTLFPGLVETILSESIIGRAQTAGKITVKAHNIRDYSKDKHKRVDDTPYGGGKGMLMMADPIFDCLSDIKSSYQPGEKTITVYMSPKGFLLNQEIAKDISEYDNIVILCGHYEGVDQRVIDESIDREISIGDYVLTGGEIPACVLVDCVARLIPGVLSAPECHESESIASGLLEYPQYTRPQVWHGIEVPEILLSGHHANIDNWRLKKSIEITGEKRSDILRKYKNNLKDEK